VAEKLTISQWAKKLSQMKSKQEKLAEIKLDLNANAKKVLETRYLMRNDKDEIIETPKEAFYRVAHHIAKAEEKLGNGPEVANMVENAFLEILTNLEFLPNSPTFSGAGTKLGQLSACFVLPIEDDMDSIMESLTKTVMIHKSGGGTGFSFSRLRPSGARISTTTGTSPGPVSFIKMYDGTTEQIKQGGTRKGANMGILRVDHPDILEFIDAKKEEGKINNFNLSVAITDKFMQAVKDGDKYDLYCPHQKKVLERVDARTVFDKIIYNAWANGEPGAFFIDKANKDNPTPEQGDFESTNPCGEQVLLPHESCNLGSINLAKFVKEDQGQKEIDWDRLKYVTRLAIRFLDNIIEVNKYPVPEIEQVTKQNRKAGLGVMGFADMLLAMGIRYGSKESLKLAEKIMKFINDEAHKASEVLAEKRGVFPAWQGSTWQKQGKKMRNATCTTIAPTGTLSFIANCSSGIEPIFSVAFIRNVLDDQKLIDVNPVFEDLAKELGFHSKKLMTKVAEAEHLADVKEVPEDIQKLFVTAHEIKPEAHVRMQAAFQKNVDNAISKTINFPNSAKIDDVKKAYFLAYDLDVKGLTIYRDGSRQLQVLEKSTKKKEDKHKADTPTKGYHEITPRKRPEQLVGYTYKTKTSFGNLYITINEDTEGRPFEVFANIGKAGGFFAAKAEAISRLISLALRSGIRAQDIVDQIKGIRGPSPAWGNSGKIFSLPDAIGQTLEKYIKHKESGKQLDLELKQNSTGQKELVKPKPVSSKKIVDNGEAPGCPECGMMLEFAEGCMSCPTCGYSKCS